MFFFATCQTSIFWYGKIQLRESWPSSVTTCDYIMIKADVYLLLSNISCHVGHDFVPR